jgi:hypothetical protein
MTTTVPHIVNRFVIDADAEFENVRERYESLVPTVDFAELVEVIGTGDYARVQQYTAEHAPNSFLNFLGARPDADDAAARTSTAGHHVPDGQ